MLHAGYEDGPEHHSSQPLFDRLQFLHVMFEIYIFAAINNISTEHMQQSEKIAKYGHKAAYGMLHLQMKSSHLLHGISKCPKFNSTCKPPINQDFKIKMPTLDT